MQVSRAMQDVREVVGPNVSDSVISTALRNHSYSVPAAINEIVDLTASSPVVIVKESKKKKKSASDDVIDLVDDDEQPSASIRRVATNRSFMDRQSSGVVVEQAISKKRMRSTPPISSTPEQQPVQSVNTGEWPKLLGRRAADAESTYRGRPPPEMIPGSVLLVKRVFGGSAKNTIVRLATNRGCEVGRLPSALSHFLAPAIDAGCVACTARVEFLPEKLDIFTRFGILLEISIKSPAAFKCFEESAVEADEQESNKSKPPQRRANDDDVSDCVWKVIQVAFGSLTVDGLFAGRVSQGALLVDDDDGEVGTGGPISPATEPELSEEQLFGGGEESKASIAETFAVNDKESESSERGLTVLLRPHQKLAINWMRMREEGLLASTTTAASQHHPLWTKTQFMDGTNFYLNRFTRMATLVAPPNVSKLCKGGILADEMGLGKTITVLGRVTQDLTEWLATKRELGNASRSSGTSSYSSSAVVSKPKSEFEDDIFETEEEEELSPKTSEHADDKEYGTLVIVVTSLLSQWEEEIDSKIAPNQKGRRNSRFTRYSYYGTERESSDAKLADADIVLTTFGVVAAEHKNKKSTLFKPTWRRIVLDEAQSVRNADTLQAKAVLELKSERRWCLTGTPVQNGIDDLFQLFRFIHLEPWGQRMWWERVIEKPYKAGNPAALQRIRSVLADGPVLLRRTHKSIETEAATSSSSNLDSGHHLPKLSSEIIRLDLSPAERSFYDSLYSRSKLEFEGMVSSGKASTSYVTILSLLVRLRQAADHPFLVLGRPKADKEEERKRDDDYIRRISAKYFSSSDDSSAATSVAATRTNSLEFAKKTLKDMAQGTTTDCTICLCAMTEPVLLKCAHSFCRSCILATVENYYGGGHCPVCREKFDKSSLVDIRLPSRENQISLKDGSVVTDAEELLTARYRSSSKLDRLVLEITNRRKVNGGKDKFLIFSQFTQMLDLCQVAMSRMDPPVKYERLDGSLSSSKREQALKKFRDNDDTEALIMSLKAGCLGLNITCANVVILMDPWWNAAVEHQAIGRAHRMGQKREVSVLRLIANDTVEVKMLAIQEKKKAVASDTLGFEQFGGAAEDDETKASSKLTLDDLKEFFS